MRRVLAIVLGLFLLLFTYVLAHDANKKDNDDKNKSANTTGNVTSDEKTHGQMSEMKDHAFYTEDDIKWVDGPPSLPPGAQMAVLDGDPAKNTLFTMRVKFPGNYVVPAHWHPADEHVTVLKGSLWMGMGDKFDANNLKELPAGSFIVMTKGTRHYGTAKDECILQVHGQGPWAITYVNPSDDPRRQHAGTAK